MDDHAPLACPRCRSALARVKRGLVTVDRCAACRGIWFDGGELEQLRGASVRSLAALDRGRVATRPVTAAECPRCRIPLSPFAFAHLPRVPLDGCRQCRGIWTDGGELALLAAAVRTASGPPAPAGVGACSACGGRVYSTDTQCMDCGRSTTEPPPLPASEIPAEPAERTSGSPAADSATEQLPVWVQLELERIRKEQQRRSWPWRDRGPQIGLLAFLFGLGGVWNTTCCAYSAIANVPIWAHRKGIYPPWLWDEIARRRPGEYVTARAVLPWSEGWWWWLLVGGVGFAVLAVLLWRVYVREKE